MKGETMKTATIEHRHDVGDQVWCIGRSIRRRCDCCDQWIDEDAIRIGRGHIWQVGAWKNSAGLPFKVNYMIGGCGEVNDHNGIIFRRECGVFVSKGAAEAAAVLLPSRSDDDQEDIAGKATS